MNATNLRPGVYSSLTMSARYATPRAVQYAGLVCQGNAALVGQVMTIRSARQAEEQLSGSDNLLAQTATKILLESGVGQVMVSLVSGANYAAAFALLAELQHIGSILSDASTNTSQQAGLASVEISSEHGRERLLFLAESNPTDAMQAAKRLNSPRCILTCGTAYYSTDTFHPLYGAAALAGKILAENHPTILLNGAVLAPLEQVERLTEAQVQELLAEGVTPLETIGGQVECIRGVTTKTKENNIENYQLRSINTVLIIDDVLQTVRKGLSARLKGMSLLGDSLNSVASQVLVELAEKKEQHIITDYQVPRVFSLPEDPSVCVVELVFSVAHVISQIHINAHVQL